MVIMTHILHYLKTIYVFIIALLRFCEIFLQVCNGYSLGIFKKKKEKSRFMVWCEGRTCGGQSVVISPCYLSLCLTQAGTSSLYPPTLLTPTHTPSLIGPSPCSPQLVLLYFHRSITLALLSSSQVWLFPRLAQIML